MAVISYLTKIQFDFGAIKLLADEMKALGIKRPLIVTDKGLVKTGILDTIRANIPNEFDVSVFDGTPENPTEAATWEALKLYKENGCDGIIAVGGGSSMDLAKGVRLLATHEGPLSQYAMVEGGVARIRPDVSKLIAVATTSGTGSEVGRGAVIVLEDGRKLALVSPYLIPNVAINDPELTLGLPPVLTAGTGMDAITHCIETFLSLAVNPPADGISLEGLRLASRSIETAVKDGSNRQARWDMMMGSMMGAMSFQKGLGAVHALSHPLGAVKGLRLHHGTLNAVFLPAVLRFNKSVVGDKYPRVAQAMGLPENTDIADAISKLNAKIGIPASLREMGVTDDLLDGIAVAATKDHAHPTNPRTPTVAEYRKLLDEAMAGN
ncbi:MAG: iron-containing alcohol dehydrogenase [Oceanibaculum sp.]